MHVLRKAEVLHENPHTGDKIIKTHLIQVHAPDSGDQSIDQLQGIESEAQQDKTVKENATAECRPQSDQGSQPSRLGSRPQQLPHLVAIKYLSDYRTRRVRYDDSSDQDSDNDPTDSRGGLPTESRNGYTSSVGRSGMDLFTPDPPANIRFGAKARQEIRALKAAQGHSSIIPFLGFTKSPTLNPFRKDLPQDNAFNEEMLSMPLPIPSVSVGDDQDLFSTLRSAPALATTNKPGNNDSDSRDAMPLLEASPLEGAYSYPINSYHSDSGSDFSDYDSDDDALDVVQTPNTPSEWRRIFSRQPKLGGIVHPYLPITIQDLIATGWTKTRPLAIETCMRQVLEGLQWLHDDTKIIHRDISSTNILIAFAENVLSNEGVGMVQCLISDFGCATFMNDSIKSSKESLAGNLSPSAIEENFEMFRSGPESGIAVKEGLTFEVGTRAYRAPELLFSSTNYTNAIDIWSAGIIFAEMYLGRRLFEADSDIGQICAIVKVLGTPTDENWPEYASMPDYGKLVFQAIDTSPLRDILHSSLQASPELLEPLEAADTTPFKIIEKMVLYSGAERLSAKNALEFDDHYLETRTLSLSLDSKHPPGSVLGPKNDPETCGQKRPLPRDDSPVISAQQPEDSYPTIEEFSRQNTVVVEEIIAQKRLLRERELDEYEEDGYENYNYGAYSYEPDTEEW